MADVASMIGYKTAKLNYLLYSSAAPPKYRTFEIPKRSGGTRQIQAPNSPLKLAQRRLATLLQDCEEEIKEKYGRHDGGKPDVVAHGFVRGRSIITNAREHRNRRFVFNLDLADFFPTFNFGRVRGFFIKNRDFALHPAVATILAQIACADGRLPQGSPCSPVIANLLAHVLDVHLLRLAGRNGCRYTRYADDLTFSTNLENFPENIGLPTADGSSIWTVGPELRHLIGRSGFRVNENKTRMQYRPARQVVTGLVVNKKVNIPADYRHRVRAMVHRLFRTGDFDLQDANEQSNPPLPLSKKMNRLHGMLGFIDSVDRYNESLHPTQAKRELSSKEQTYRRFLLFKDFFTAEKPVLVCEGKTDLVYLTHAIRGLARRYPRLANVDASGKIELGIRRYRYADKGTGRILGISGGHGGLQKLLLAYRDSLQKYGTVPSRHAIVVLVDNDSAAGPVLSTIKEITGEKADRTKPFIHVIQNMYVVFTPLLDGEKSMIEDCFDHDIKARKLNGKTFDPSNDHSTASHYGKADFAFRVVQPNAATINFENFSTLLTNITQAVEHANPSAP